MVCKSNCNVSLSESHSQKHLNLNINESFYPHSQNHGVLKTITHHHKTEKITQGLYGGKLYDTTPGVIIYLENTSHSQPSSSFSLDVTYNKNYQNSCEKTNFVLNLITFLIEPVIGQIIKKVLIETHINGIVQNKIELLFTQQCQRILFGRSPDCEITVAHPTVAKVHAQLSLNSIGILYIEDLNSNQGTLVDNIWIKPGIIREIYLGSFIKLAASSRTYVITQVITSIL